MISQLGRLAIFLSIFLSYPAVAMVCDNRFIPLYPRPRLTIDSSRSEFLVQGFVTTADRSFNEFQQNIPLSEIFGKFDQATLSRAISSTGKTNVLPSEFQILSRIPWNVSGKRQSQGIVCSWHQSLAHRLSIGCSWLFMRVISNYHYALEKDNIEPRVSIKPGDLILLDDTRRAMFEQIGIKEGHTQQIGMGDLECFLRIGDMWEYMARFRRIDAGCKLGVLVPTGVMRDIDRPASIPFGGQGHWGLYGSVDALFELKEDLKIGFLARIQNRFATTHNQRMPAGQEPMTYGAIVGRAHVNPGSTVCFIPYFLFEHMRQGLAFGLNYNLLWHFKDSWSSSCTKRESLKDVETRSQWSSEFFTINVFYDFSALNYSAFTPIVSLQWDAPSNFFIASRSNRAHKISIGIDFVY